MIPLTVGSIGSLHIVRSICNPLHDDEVRLEASLSLALSEIDGDIDGRHAYVTMEVIAPASTGRYFVGATVMAVVGIDSRDTSTPAARNGLLADVVPAVVHPMWDYSLSHLRMLVSGLIDATLDAPDLTPDPIMLSEEEGAADDSAGPSLDQD